MIQIVEINIWSTLLEGRKSTNNALSLMIDGNFGNKKQADLGPTVKCSEQRNTVTRVA